MRNTLDAGFTTVRNVGASDYADVGLKQAIVLDIPACESCRRPA